jgi:hypothetical protein
MIKKRRKAMYNTEGKKYYYQIVSNGYCIAEIFGDTKYPNMGEPCDPSHTLFDEDHYVYNLYLGADRRSVTSGSGSPWSLPQTMVGKMHYFMYYHDHDVFYLIRPTNPPSKKSLTQEVNEIYDWIIAMRPMFCGIRPRYKSTTPRETVDFKIYKVKGSDKISDTAISIITENGNELLINRVQSYWATAQADIDNGTFGKHQITITTECVPEIEYVKERFW